MKIYVASSWRNENQPAIVERLKICGFDVYDFRHPVTGDAGFHWSEIDPEWQSWSPDDYIEKLRHQTAERGFAFDYAALNQCDIAVLVMPCGRSAHLELGYMLGQGKPGYILLTEAEPELMYKMATGIYSNIDVLALELVRRFPTRL